MTSKEKKELHEMAVKELAIMDELKDNKSFNRRLNIRLSKPIKGGRKGHHKVIIELSKEYLT